MICQHQKNGLNLANLRPLGYEPSMIQKKDTPFDVSISVAGEGIVLWLASLMSQSFLQSSFRRGIDFNKTTFSNHRRLFVLSHEKKHVFLHQKILQRFVM